jgi:hypothetical protein
MRFRDYARQIRGLLANLGGNADGDQAAAAAMLERYSERVVTVSGDDDIEELIRRLSRHDPAGQAPVGGP